MVRIQGVTKIGTILFVQITGRTLQVFTASLEPFLQLRGQFTVIQSDSFLWGDKKVPLRTGS